MSAGYLIAGPGLAACYGADAVGFAVFGAAMLFVRPLRPAVRTQRPGLQSLREGLSYVRRSPVVGGMLLIDTNAMIFGMPTALFPALAREHFHGGSATFGLLAAAPAPRRHHWRRHQRMDQPVRRPGMVVIGAGLLWGASIVAFGLTTILPVALAVLALAGMSDMISELLRNALLQHYTPGPLRGRVSSLYLA